MSETHSPIPYAEVTRDELPKEAVARPLPDSIETLMRYAAGDRAFAPPHWVRMRAPRDASVAARFLAALDVLTPLAFDTDRPDLKKAWLELELDANDPAVQRFAATTIEQGQHPNADRSLFVAASKARGERFDALFARAGVPLTAYVSRLAALREHDGMPWSDAFAAALAKGLPKFSRDAASWLMSLIAELPAPEARRFLQARLATLNDERQREDLARLLARPATLEAPPEEEPLPTSMDKLELGAIDPRKPKLRVPYLGRIAVLDWPRARRLASSIATDEWNLDETVGALLNHATQSVMIADFHQRGLIPEGVVPVPGKLSARELMRQGGRVVHFDTTSMEGIIDHDALAYAVAEASGGLGDIDFLEVVDGNALYLDAWDGGRHYRVELDTRRSIVDPYGLVGLVNVLLRERGRPERCLLAAEEKGMCDVVVGPEAAIRSLVEAGLLWIRSSFKW